MRDQQMVRGPLFLYSATPAPHERRILNTAALRPGRDPGAPLRVVVLMTPLADPPPHQMVGLRRHFGTQGVEATIEDAGLATREDAHDPDVVRRLTEADLVLITGGSTTRLIETTAGTPALSALEAASAAGAVVAGCSAGALVLGAGYFSGRPPERRALRAWGWLPRTVVAPHFGRYELPPWAEAFPGTHLVGIPNQSMALAHPDGRIEALGVEPLTIVTANGRSTELAPGQVWSG